MVFFLISFASAISWLVIFYAVLGVGLPLWSVIAAYSQEYTAKSMQGRVQAFFSTIGSFVLMFTYLFLAINSVHVGIQYCYWFCVVLGISALLIILCIYRAPDVVA